MACRCATLFDRKNLSEMEGIFVEFFHINQWLEWRAAKQTTLLKQGCWKEEKTTISRTACNSIVMVGYGSRHFDKKKNCPTM